MTSNSSEEPLHTQVERALAIEEIDCDLFFANKNLWKPPGGRGVYGGQVIGQALVAATRSVESPFLVHSLHTYFLRPGDSTKSIVYRVNRERDGTSFKTRAVHASQSGKLIFMMICSFQRPEWGLEHQSKMPDAPDPDKMKSDEEKARGLIQKEDVPDAVKKWIKLQLADPFPIDIVRTVPIREQLKGLPMEARQKIWIRAKGNLGDRISLHQCVAAYASDNLFLATCLLPHGLAGFSKKIKQMATIDHSMWFHGPFRADDWLLFEMESPRTAGARGLVVGKLFTRDGRLVVTCTQEGLIRTRATQETAKL